MAHYLKDVFRTVRLTASCLLALLGCRAHVFGAIFFSEPFGILGVAGTCMIAIGVLAVSLDKQGSVTDAAIDRRAASASALKAKSSFRFEPDDFGAQEAGAEGRELVTARAVQLEPLDPGRRHGS